MYSMYMYMYMYVLCIYMYIYIGVIFENSIFYRLQDDYIYIYIVRPY